MSFEEYRKNALYKTQYFLASGALKLYWLLVNLHRHRLRDKVSNDI